VAVKAKVRALTRAGSNQPLAALLGHLNRVLRGWTAFFRYGVSKRTFDYLGQFAWNRVLRWLRRKHPKASWGWLRRRYLPRWWPTHGKTELLRCGHVTVSRYRYRGAQIPSPWAAIG
jgi:RNA-directed DNA polymerase